MTEERLVKQLEKMKQTLAAEGLPAVSKACDFKGQLERVECPA